MKFGKFEIDWFVSIVLAFVIITAITLIADNKLKIEEEKTKQLELQYKINKEEIEWQNEMN